MQVICPICKNKTTWEENPWRPFCSERCKLIDLGKWVSEGYKIEGKETDSKEQTASDGVESEKQQADK
jgi:endogenous inhibitor of DNA gyrase (YacG/DUF329 family)